MIKSNMCCCCGEKNTHDNMHDIKIKGKNKKICKECATSIKGLA